MAYKQCSRSYSDLLYTVFEKLEDRDDRLNCLAVCESWKLVIENQYPEPKRYFPYSASFLYTALRHKHRQFSTSKAVKKSK